MADYTLKAQKRDEAREELRRGDYLRQYVERITTVSPKAGKSHGRPMYVCPFCGSGTGKGKTGAFSLYEEKGVQKHGSKESYVDKAVDVLCRVCKKY